MNPQDGTAVIEPTRSAEAVRLDNTTAYEVPVDPMDDLWCESCQ